MNDEMPKDEQRKMVHDAENEIKLEHRAFTQREGL